MKYFEDIGVGEISDIGRHIFTAEDIKGFAARFDPQPFHLDEAAAARSHFGRLCASGWHTACVWMRLLSSTNISAASGGASASIAARSASSPSGQPDNLISATSASISDLPTIGITPSDQRRRLFFYRGL